MRKKICLIIVILLFLVLNVKVDAIADNIDKYRIKWQYKVESEESAIYTDIIAINSDFFSIGYDQTRGAIITKHDFKGNKSWELFEKNYLFTKIIEVKDGILVVGITTENTIIAIKYDYDGNLKWQIEKEGLGILTYDELEQNIFYMGDMYLDCLATDDKIIISSINFVSIYDQNGNLLKELSTNSEEDTEISGSTTAYNNIALDDNYLYVVGITSIDDVGYTIINKFDIKNYELISTKKLFEMGVKYTSIYGDTETSLMLPIYITKTTNGIVVYSTFNDPESKDSYQAIEIYDNNLEKITKKIIGQEVYEIKAIGNDLYVIELFKSSSDSSNAFFAIKKYNNELEEVFTFYKDNINFTDVVEKNTMLILTGYQENSGFITIYSEPYKNQWEQIYDTSEIDEYFFDVVGYDEGAIAIGSSCMTQEPQGSDDNTCAGLIVRYDTDGNLLWDKKVEGYEFIKAHKMTDGFVVIGNNNKQKSIDLNKYDFDGNLIWEKQILVNDYLNHNETNDVYLSVYNDIVAFSANRKNTDGDFIALYNTDGDLIEELTKSNEKNQIVNINEKGIYIYAMDSKFNDYLYKYNNQYELEKTFTLDDVVFAINDVKGKLIVITRKKIHIINQDLTIHKTIQSTSNIYVSDIVETETGFIVAYRDRLIEYDMDLDIMWELEIDYRVTGLDLIDNEFVVSGYVTENKEIKGVASKYSYPIYNIISETDGNGTITVSHVTSESGQEIAFTVEPKEGYVLKKVVVTTASGEVLEFTDYKFTMPSDDVEIFVEFEKINNPNTGITNPFNIVLISILITVIVYKTTRRKKYI